MNNESRISKVNWNEQFKIRPRRNASIKHEHIKLQLILSIMERHKKDLNWIRIYSEFPIGDRICDIYYENVKTNEMIFYEIQKKIGKAWLDNTKSFYKNLNKPFFKTDWILIKEDEISEDIELMSNQLRKLII
jgi:hypothetical protein